jgi:hypothetical protein
MCKQVVAAPDWVGAGAGADVYSVSGCISRCFADYVPYWRHNGFWFFDRPEIALELAREHGLDLSGATLFYYEVHDREYDETSRSWAPLAADLPFPVDVRGPDAKRLEGYDVVTFSCRTSPECSPLSCNGLAARTAANVHCLLESLEQAQRALESGLFDGSEPGPFRILAVYTVAGDGMRALAEGAAG